MAGTQTAPPVPWGCFSLVGGGYFPDLFLNQMQHTLREHITGLEEKIVALKREMRDPHLSEYQRSEREIALSNAEEALRLFRRAYELEQQVQT